jgi:transcriptional regulator with XRE-family HTH domain
VIFVYYVEFGAILKATRLEKGLSQEKLGALVGLSKALISKYENAVSYPPYNVLIRFANVFNVSTDYLLGVEKKRTLNIEGLTNKQIDSLITVAKEYQELNAIKR